MNFALLNTVIRVPRCNQKEDRFFGRRVGRQNAQVLAVNVIII